MRGINLNLVMPGVHTLKLNQVKPRFWGIHVGWRITFHYQFLNYSGHWGYCPCLILETPKKEGEYPAALFFNCPPGSYSKNLAEAICGNINHQYSGKFFEVGFKPGHPGPPQLISMREVLQKEVQ